MKRGGVLVLCLVWYVWSVVAVSALTIGCGAAEKPHERAPAVISAPAASTPQRAAISHAELDRLQCHALTKRGARCKRMSEPGKRYCWQHVGKH